METANGKGDPLSQPLASVIADATAAKEEPLKDRIPIIWKGKARDDASSSKAAEAPETTEKQQTPEPKPLQRMKPNAAFLLNVVADAQRGNERLCADEATNASLTVLGQAVSAGIRPQLDRFQQAGGSALRAAVLSVAQQQKLATCTALLKEVAMAYGFALHIDPEVGEAVAVTEAAPAPEPKAGYTPVQPLHVRLNLASQGDHAALAEAVTASQACARPDPEPKGVPRAPAIDVRANRLAGTAFGALGLPGAAPPPLAVRKLQRAKARQKDRAGIFAASDAAPADSSQGEDSAEALDAEPIEEDYVSAKQPSHSMPEAAAASTRPKVWSQNRAGRPSSAPLQNGHRSVSSARSEASSMDEQPELVPSRLPRPQAVRAGAAHGLPNGLPSGRPSKMPMHEADDVDEELAYEDSPEPSRKRLRSSVHDSAAGYARGPAIQASAAQRHGRAPGNGRAASNGRALDEELPDGSESEEAEELEASDEELPPQRQPAQPVRSGMRADSAIANGQAGSLRARLGSSAASQGRSLAQRVTGSGLRFNEGTQDAMKKGAKGSRGLFSAALTGLQR